MVNETKSRRPRCPIARSTGDNHVNNLWAGSPARSRRNLLQRGEGGCLFFPSVHFVQWLSKVRFFVFRNGCGILIQHRLIFSCLRKKQQPEKSKAIENNK